MNSAQPQTLSITGMTCGGCAGKVSARLREHPGIAAAEVTLEPPMARITARSPLKEDDLNEWLRPLGKYRVSVSSSSSSSVPGPGALRDAPASHEQGSPPAKDTRTYKPLIILLGYLLAVIAANAIAHGWFDLGMAMRLFMGGFFIAFSFFKMLDLRGFADAYRSYDIVAKAVPPYGFVYPFIELALGLAYLADWQPLWVNVATAVVMAVSLAGVLRAVLSKKAIRCACLGTVFNLPMSTVTIVEDALMLAMALLSFVLPHG